MTSSEPLLLCNILSAPNPSWLLGVLEPAVAAYGLRLCRKLGTHRVGWSVFAAFCMLALVHALPAPSGILPATSLFPNWAVIIVSALLLIGMAHTESIAVGRVHAEENEQALRQETDRQVQQQLTAVRAERDRLLAQFARGKEREDLLQKSAVESQSLFADNPQAMWVLDRASCRFLAVNKSALKLFGSSEQEFLARSASELFGSDNASKLKNDLNQPADAPQFRGLWQCTKNDGTRLELEFREVDLPYSGSAARLFVVTDVGARQREEFLHWQHYKRDVLVRVSGAAASQFEKLVRVLETETERCFQENPPSDFVDPLTRISAATERLGAITRELFIVGRRFPAETRSLDLNQFLSEQEPFIRQIAGSAIRCHLSCSPRPAWLAADPRLLRHILTNLVRNAAAAMAGRGALCITTSTILLPDSQVQLETAATEVVCLSIRDTGHGISPEVQERLFEPFLSEPGSSNGLGLGLASTLGAVEQLSGRIDVVARPGIGTEFRLWFPCATPPTTTQDTQHARTTVLLLEPTAKTRTLARAVLEWHGYRVIETDSTDLAKLMWNQKGAAVDLLITDAGLPGDVSRTEFIEDLRHARPGLHVLFTSDEASQGAASLNTLALLKKPFTSAELLDSVHRCLSSK